MNSSTQMQAVIELPYHEDRFSCPWQIPEFKPFSMLQLRGEMTYPQIGLVFAQLADFNQIELENDTQVVLEQILEAESLALPGGIQVISEEKVIAPSCCCGLETWREWIDFLETGESPWLGHDPSPWVESQSDIVRVWSDGGIVPTNQAFHIDVLRSDLEISLRAVEQELQAFLLSVESWAQEVGFVESTKLLEKFDECFRIGTNST